MPYGSLPPDADLVLVQNVPVERLSRLIPDQVSESPRARHDALRLVREHAVEEAVREAYLEHRLGGRFAVTWVTPPEEVSLQRCTQVFPTVSNEYLADHVPEADDFWPIWVDSVDGRAAARFVFLLARQQVRLRLGFDERPVLDMATLIFRRDAIEFRCVAKKLRSLMVFINERLGLLASQMNQMSVRDNQRAAALKDELNGRFVRARAKMGVKHDFDLVDVGAQDDIDLGMSQKWLNEYEPAQGRGRYIEFFEPEQGPERTRHVIRVAQRDITISFVTPATEAAVQRVRKAVLRSGIPT